MKLIDKILKAAGVKTKKEFYEKYPDEDVFFAAHPQLAHIRKVSQMNVPSKSPYVYDFLYDQAPIGTKIKPDTRAADVYSGPEKNLKDIVNSYDNNPARVAREQNFAFPHGKTSFGPDYAHYLTHKKSKGPNTLPVNSPDIDMSGRPETPSIPDYSHLSFPEAFAKARKENGPGSTFIWNKELKGTLLAEETMPAPSAQDTIPTFPSSVAASKAMDYMDTAIDPGYAGHMAAITGMIPAMNAANTLGDYPTDKQSPAAGPRPGGGRYLEYQAYGGAPTADEFYQFGLVPMGPQFFYEDGGISIDPSKRGTFTAAATKHGKGVQAFASQVLANPDNYSPAMVKKANFARNAAKWKKADGGDTEKEMTRTEEITNSRFDNTMNFIKDKNMMNFYKEEEDFFKCGGPHKMKKMFNGGDDTFRGNSFLNAGMNMMDQYTDPSALGRMSYFSNFLGLDPYMKWKGSINDQKFNFNTDVPMGKFGIENIRDLFTGTPAVDPNTLAPGQANIQQFKYKKAPFGPGPRKVKLRGQFNFGTPGAPTGTPSTDPFSGTNPGPWSPEYMADPGYNNFMMPGQFDPTQPMSPADPGSYAATEKARKKGEKRDFRQQKRDDRMYFRGQMFDERMKNKYADLELQNLNRADAYNQMVPENAYLRGMDASENAYMSNMGWLGHQDYMNKLENKEAFNQFVYGQNLDAERQKNMINASKREDKLNRKVDRRTGFEEGGEYEMSEAEIAELIKQGYKVEYL